MSMCVNDTVVTHQEAWGLHVKHEEQCCPGGPDFSKTRGVYMHVADRSEEVIGVLDTSHSQGGWAVARACQMLGKQCHVFYPVRKAEASGATKPQQVAARELGATLWAMSAGRSAILYHRARQELTVRFGSSAYMMPNALKLAESVEETAREVDRTWRKMGDALPPRVLVSASSGTIAAGVCLGLVRRQWEGDVIVHLGYDRPHDAVRKYIRGMAGIPDGTQTGLRLTVVSEGYGYADRAKPGPDPLWPCNEYYDLKAFRWWTKFGRAQHESAVLWNIG